MPGGVGRSFPNEFLSSLVFGAGGNDLAFGFNAGMVRLRNRAAHSVYFCLRSTTGATTGDHELGSSEDIVLNNLGAGVYGMSVNATSSGGYLTIGAWG